MKKVFFTLLFGLLYMGFLFAEETTTLSETHPKDRASDLPVSDNRDTSIAMAEIPEVSEQSKNIDIFLTPNLFYENIMSVFYSTLYSFIVDTEDSFSFHILGAGLDSQYVFPSGFTMYFNNQLGVFGRFAKQTIWPFIQYQLDFLLGYTFRPGNHLIGLSAGCTLGTGYPIVFLAGATARFDYAYLPNQKVGVQVSITDSFGFGFSNTLSAKLGCVVKL